MSSRGGGSLEAQPNGGDSSMEISLLLSRVVSMTSHYEKAKLEFPTAANNDKAKKFLTGSAKSLSRARNGRKGKTEAFNWVHLCLDKPSVLSFLFSSR